MNVLCLYSDPLRGPVQELDLGSDEEDEEDLVPSKLKGKKTKQSERPVKIIPTASDASSDEDEDDEDEDDGVEDEDEAMGVYSGEEDNDEGEDEDDWDDEEEVTDGEVSGDEDEDEDSEPEERAPPPKRQKTKGKR